MRDDRDLTLRRGVPLSHVLRLVRWPAQWRAASRSTRRRLLLRALLRSGPVWLGLLVVALVVMLSTLMIRDTAVGLGLLIISPVMAPLVATGLLTVRGLLGFGGDLPRMLRAAALAAGECPACRYPLRELAAEADGCVRCPECGAAWNWDAIGDRGGRDPEVIVIRNPLIPPG